MKLQFQKDWSLAHFISYLAAITAVLLGIQLVTQIVMHSTTQVGLDFSISYQWKNSEQISIKEGGLSFFPNNKREGLLIIKGIQDKPAIHFYLLAIFKYLQTGLYIFGAFLVWNIFGSIAEKKPFIKENYKRLFIIGWSFVLAELMALGGSFYLNWLVSDVLETSSLDLMIRADMGSNTLVIGMIIIVLGYVFREAHHLNEEQRLTV